MAFTTLWFSSLHQLVLGVLDPCHLQEVELFFIILLVQSFVDPPVIPLHWGYFQMVALLELHPSYCSVWFHHEVCTDSSIIGEGKVNIWITWDFLAISSCAAVTKSPTALSFCASSSRVIFSQLCLLYRFLLVTFLTVALASSMTLEPWHLLLCLSMDLQQ